MSPQDRFPSKGKEVNTVFVMYLNSMAQDGIARSNARSPHRDALTYRECSSTHDIII